MIKKRKTNNNSFTLVELVVVLVVLGILIAVALPSYTGFVERSRQAEAISILSQVHASQLRFFYEHDSLAWPGDLSDLDIEMPTLKYFRGDELQLDSAGGVAMLQRNPGDGWTYILAIDGDGNFYYDPSSGSGPGGLPE